MAKLLQALDGWLEKAKQHAEAKSFDPAVLLQARLAPDMYTLSRQIRRAEARQGRVGLPANTTIMGPISLVEARVEMLYAAVAPDIRELA